MTREVKNGKVAFKGGQLGEWTTMSGKFVQVLITRIEKKYKSIWWHQWCNEVSTIYRHGL